MKRESNPGAIDFSDILASEVVTEEDLERRLNAMAMRVVESRLLDGTASSQETTAILRRNSRLERLQEENLRKDLELKDAKIRSLEQQERSDKMFAEAMEALKEYRPENNYVQQDIYFFKEEDIPGTV